MHIGISNLCYEHKPTQEEIEKMKFSNKEVNIDDFSSLIKEGYAYTSVMSGKRNRDNFVSSYTLTFDIDDSSTEMMDCLRNLDYKPSLAYTSPSNGLDGKGFRYRLVYCLDEPITTFEEYYVMSRSFGAQLGLTDVDPKSFYPEQFWNGSKGCSCVVTDTVYNKRIIDIKEDFKEEFKKNYLYKKKIGKEHKSITKTIIKQTQHNGLNDTFEDDFWNLSYTEFLNKYDYPNVERSPIELDEITPLIKYPDDYYEIKRPWERINGETKKIKDREGRRRKLFLNGIIRRKINPDITFDNLLYNLIYEFQYYYINDGNKIDKKTLYEIAGNVMSAEIFDSDLGKPRYGSFVNPLYCQKHGMTKKQVMGSIRNKRQYIGQFYDFTKTDQENLDIMKEYGLDVKIATLKRWKKENGIRKYRKKTKI